MQISRGGFRERQHLLLELRTSSGHRGFGEAIGNPRRAFSLLDEQFAESVFEGQFRDPSELLFALTEGDVYYERAGSLWSLASAVEMAAWDCILQSEAMSLAEFHDRPKREAIRSYASSLYWQEDVGILREQASEAMDVGVAGLKVHLGREGPVEEGRRIAAIRGQIGSDVPLMVDLNCGYTREQAKAAVKIWSDHDIFWLEEPLHPEDREGLIDLAKTGQTRIAFGENASGVGEITALASQLALFESEFVAMPDLGRIGGITGLKNLLRNLKPMPNVVISPHNYASGILLAATYACMSLSDELDWLELDLSGNSYYFDALKSRVTIDKGVFSMAGGQGLGGRLDVTLAGSVTASCSYRNGGSAE